MYKNNKAAKVNIATLPSVEEAVHQYTSLGGTLTEPHPFGCDPLYGNAHLQQIHHTLFFQKCTFDSIFHAIVNGNDSLFKSGLMLLINITERLIN